MNIKKAEQIIFYLKKGGVTLIIFSDYSQIETNAFPIPSLEDLSLYQELKNYLQQFYKKSIRSVTLVKTILKD